MLLSAYQQAAQRDAERMRQRRRAVRTLFGVAGAAALLVGCIAAVDVFTLNGGDGHNTMTLQVRAGAQDVDDEAIAMESQFGWNSIGYGWCSIKSSTWCMFSKDKEKCKEGINCYKDRVQASADDDGAYEGSGSGDFNATVGDGVDVGEGDEEEETPSAAAPATPADNPTEPLDLGGGDEEAGDDAEEAPADDEGEEETTEDDDEAPADDEEDAPEDEEVADDEEAPEGDEEETGEDETVTEDKDNDENMGGED